MVETFSLCVGVVVDPPYVEPFYASVNEDDSPAKRVLQWGTDFEIMYQIFRNMLRLSRLSYIEFATYNESYEALSKGIVNLLVVRESLRTYYQYMAPFGNITVTPVFDRGGLTIYYKQRYDSHPVYLLGRVSPMVLMTILIITALVVVQNYMAKKYLKAAKLISPTIWFIVCTVFLGLFSNLITADLITRSDRLVEPFTDMQDMIDKWYTGKCSAVTLKEDGVEDIYSFVNSKFKTLLLQSELKYPPRRLATRNQIAEILLSSESCTFAIDYRTNSGFYLLSYEGIAIKGMDEIATTGLVFAMNKNIPPKIQSEIRVLLSDSSVEELPRSVSELYYQGIRYNTNTTNNSKKMSELVHPIDFYKVVDAMIVVSVGCVLGGIVLTCEKYIGYKQVAK